MQQVLALNNITKRFGSLLANDNISLALHAGEVLALLGENGAGKSTLVSILFGHYAADAGSITAFGKPLASASPQAALAAGIGMVHQHFTLADNLSVLDNVLVGTEPLWRWRSSRAAARAKLLALANQFGLAVNPDALCGALSVGEKQRVEILKALYRGARLLILDEPTAVLTPQESEGLFATLQAFQAEGLAIIFISHKLDEVMRVAQRVAVLRAGKLVAEVAVADTSRGALALLMVGREVQRPTRDLAVSSNSTPCVLALNSAQNAHGLNGVSLNLHAGEILAIAGVAGNGQQALADVLCGLEQATNVTLFDKPAPSSPRAWAAAGVGSVPEDRAHLGVVGECALWENAVLDRLPAFSHWGFVNPIAARAHAQGIADVFDVRCRGLKQVTQSLSGGNIQKLILGRVLQRAPRLLVVNQPTWGLDVGAVAFIHEQLLAARRQGAAILLISEDLDEIFALADRVAVMFKGRIAAGDVRPVAHWSLQSLGLAMAGVEQKAELLHAA